MKAAVIRRYGPPGAIEISEVPAAVPGPGQVLVRVRAASLNPLDVKLRSGAYRRIMSLTFPAVIGFDFAGVIEDLGEGVTGWSKGDRVYGRTDARTGGTHAELAVVGAQVLDRIPERLSFEEAAGLPLVTMTALQAFRKTRLAAGERLLVNGAAGGVGSVAIQVGRAVGATVTGVASTGGATLVAKLGFPVLDYSKGELARTAQKFDVILDAAGSAPTAELRRALDRRGRYVSTGFSATLFLRSALGPLFSRQRFHWFVSKPDGEMMRRVSDMAAAGRLVPVVDSVFPLDRIAEAHERMERGHLRGKVIVTIP